MSSLVGPGPDVPTHRQYAACLVPSVLLSNVCKAVLQQRVPVCRSVNIGRTCSIYPLWLTGWLTVGWARAGLRVEDVGRAGAVVADMRKIIRQDPRIIQKLHRRVFLDKLTREQVGETLPVPSLQKM